MKHQQSFVTKIDQFHPFLAIAHHHKPINQASLTKHGHRRIIEPVLNIISKLVINDSQASSTILNQLLAQH